MAWIKRNLIFVITMAVGLGATGYCAFLFYQNLGANTQAKSDYDDTYQQFSALQGKTPYPSEDNIKSAEADYQTALQFLTSSGSMFAGFPTPPKVDERGFKSYLEDTVFDLRNAAGAAGVQIPDDYDFAFSSQQKTLRYDAENIQPWMEQLEEIKALCNIIFQAKVNSLDLIRRVHVSDSDFGNGADYIETRSTTNENQIVTPYVIIFHGFSRDLANVLTDFASATNCFIVKTIDLSAVNNEAFYTPEPVAAPPETGRFMPPADAGQAGDNGIVDPRRRYFLQAQAQAAAAPTPAPVITQPVTVLSEKILRVTMTVAVVRFTKGVEQ